MPDYVYRGAQPYVPKPGEKPYKPRATRPKMERPPFDPALCGSMDGYRQHRRFDERQCARCLGAHNEQQRKYRAGERIGR